MPLEITLPVCISAAACFIAWMAFRRNVKQDTESNATERATMSADIRYIRISIDEIKLENRAIKRDLDDLKGRVIVLEQLIDPLTKK